MLLFLGKFALNFFSKQTKYLLCQNCVLNNLPCPGKWGKISPGKVAFLKCKYLYELSLFNQIVSLLTSPLLKDEFYLMLCVTYHFFGYRFNADFGQEKEILKWSINYLDATKAGLLTHLLDDGGPVNIIYQSYDWSMNS